MSTKQENESARAKRYKMESETKRDLHTYVNQCNRGGREPND